MKKNKRQKIKTANEGNYGIGILTARQKNYQCDFILKTHITENLPNNL